MNFGAAFGAGLTHDEKQQREKRFIDLLDTDAEELPYKLRQAITLIARDGVGLDWVLLIRHLGHGATRPLGSKRSGPAASGPPPEVASPPNNPCVP